MDLEVDWPDDRRRQITASIDREAEWLNRLVTNLRTDGPDRDLGARMGGLVLRVIPKYG